MSKRQLTDAQKARLSAAGWGYAWTAYPDHVPHDILALLDRAELVEAQAVAALEAQSAERERMVYWLLRAHRAMESIGGWGALADADLRSRREAHERIEALLCEIGYAIYSAAAIKMLADGEPGRRR